MKPVLPFVLPPMFLFACVAHPLLDTKSHHVYRKLQVMDFIAVQEPGGQDRQPKPTQTTTLRQQLSFVSLANATMDRSAQLFLPRPLHVARSVCTQSPGQRRLCPCSVCTRLCRSLHAQAPCRPPQCYLQTQVPRGGDPGWLGEHRDHLPNKNAIRYPSSHRMATPYITHDGRDRGNNTSRDWPSMAATHVKLLTGKLSEMKYARPAGAVVTPFDDLDSLKSLEDESCNACTRLST